ncbi:uncharacterized protein [Antennarius striatus]|uniref:uncharacterized protein n=1 Tax=Antennarius striatus TaxID=241820 RepID=UPI0035AE9B9C
MDLILVFMLPLCWWTAAARPMWSEKPRIIIDSSDIQDGEAVVVVCTLPIDYRGGECRLYRDGSQTPFRVTGTTHFLCRFHLTSRQLLGTRPVGSRVYLRCDYHLQQYTSALSDVSGVTVWGSRPSPTLSVGNRFVSPDDSVEVTCSLPVGSAFSCRFYRGEIRLAEGSCSRNLTGEQLTVWEKKTVLLPVNLTCRYDPEEHLSIRSEPSNHKMLFVVDWTQVSSSGRWDVLADDDQMEAFRNGIWVFVGAGDRRVTIQPTNHRPAPNETCSTQL